jgi:hypothetical protein
VRLGAQEEEVNSCLAKEGDRLLQQPQSTNDFLSRQRFFRFFQRLQQRRQPC